jgi:hypothetical protein
VLGFVWPGDDWLTARPGPEPDACRPLFAFEGGTVVVADGLPVEEPEPVVPVTGPWPWPCVVDPPPPAFE